MKSMRGDRPIFAMYGFVMLNKKYMVCVLSWRRIYAFTQVKQTHTQPFMWHSNPYIILYFLFTQVFI